MFMSPFAFGLSVCLSVGKIGPTQNRPAKMFTKSLEGFALQSESTSMNFFTLFSIEKTPL